MRDLTLKQLRIVAEIGRSGRIAGAAATLGVTPPAVTQQVKLLEATMGLALFERTRSGLKPTDAGRLVIEAAERVRDTLEDCGETLRALRGLAGGKVAVGLVSTAKYFAPRALAAFAGRHPGIELRLQVGNRAQTLAALEQRELDIAITGYPPDTLALERRVIGAHPHVVIAPPDHALGARGRLAMSDLAREAFIVREPGSGTRALMEAVLTQARLAPRIALEVSSNETIKQAVMAGLGIAFISGHTVAAELESRRLVVLPIAGLPVIRQWFAVRHVGKRMLPAAHALWAFLVAEGAAFLPSATASGPSSAAVRAPRRRGSRA